MMIKLFICIKIESGSVNMREVIDKNKNSIKQKIRANVLTIKLLALFKLFMAQIKKINGPVREN